MTTMPSTADSTIDCHRAASPADAESSSAMAELLRAGPVYPGVRRPPTRSLRRRPAFQAPPHLREHVDAFVLQASFEDLDMRDADPVVRHRPPAHGVSPRHLSCADSVQERDHAPTARRRKSGAIRRGKKPRSSGKSGAGCTARAKTGRRHGISRCTPLARNAHSPLTRGLHADRLGLPADDRHDHGYRPRVEKAGCGRVSAVAARPTPPLSTTIAAGAIAAIVLHVLLRAAAVRTATAALPLYAILLFGGVPLTYGLVRKAARRQLGSDLLAGISIVTAAILGEYLAGSLVVLMLAGGEALEQYALRTASSVLDALARRMPSVAHRKRDAEMVDVPLEAVAVGDVLLVHPHETCPVDGEVIEGHGKMDEAYLTGEPFEITKTRGSRVISGAI